MSIPAPASTAEAMDMVLTGLSHLATTDPTALAAQAQAECLHGLEQADAISTAARAWFLGAFTNGQGYAEDADYSPTAWLIHRTKVTKGAARGHVVWSRRAITHPRRSGAVLRGPPGPGRDHVCRRRRHDRRPHPRVRRRGHRGAGIAVGPDGC